MSSGSNHKVTRLPADNPRLDQPSDAVPMEHMAQGTTSVEEPNTAARAYASHESQIVAVEPPSVSKTTTPTDPEQRSAVEANNAEAVSKGKEKEEVAPVPPNKERSDSILAIGPAQDDIHTAPGQSDSTVCNITLLLTSGSRHPYKIDAKYLTRRNVTMPDETESGQPDPFSISIYTLKELILREWRGDWEAKPASPSSIRLIHFGKLLDDKEQLKKYQFSTESPNVVHMSIRPQDLDEEEPKSGSKNLPGGSGDGQRSRSGGMCCVIL
ncbi:Ubiquitin [Metarhizium album ARSEF 1941]|uniref:Ubiquitin n=1 Tax=Metarhizium album (strain ARSEF 1941) TaxID=1081103 RepID=A0A0B2WVJ1_METAS|nr:Ubiquitin [Metarhizium album ARSEF 1941]KHN98088.1 Ubiquitin [Metarhizium album ARSEF 1941]